jgi:ubiquinone/menaquinone biosynthesis C-methylase UbiE
MSETRAYHPEEYWSDVAKKIDKRQGHNVLAGDDSPFYRYKREQFLKMLGEVDLQGKNIMELGSGPGGNIKFLLGKNPASLTGADISQNMIDVATQFINDNKAQFVKINGEKLPFKDEHFDMVFSATVLQHNTDDDMMQSILKEMCRVSGDRVFLFERVESNFKGDDLCMGRPYEYYQTIVESQGFQLKNIDFINIQVSYVVSGIIRKVFNAGSRKEGQAESWLATTLQKITLPVTKILDKVFTAKRDLARIEFTRKK